MAANGVSSKPYTREAYVHGNTVRKNVQILADPRRDPMEHLRQQEIRERRRTIAQAERISFLYVMFLTAAAVVLVFICYQFLKMQTTMNKNVAEISSLQVQLEDMKAENDFHLARIRESVDLNAIRQTAMDKLGMKEADDSQIVNYTYDDSDYVRQYKDVPDGDTSSVLDYFSE